MAREFRLAVASVNKAEPELDAVRAIYTAGEREADLVLLPEEPEVVAGKEPGQSTLEEHPQFRLYCEAAQKSGIAVVGSLSAQVEQGVANAGFFLNRRGELQGCYRKKHPAPTEEYIATEEPGGDPFPVFEFEGVRFGIAICMDIHFPEMFRIYGLKGADLVLVPTMYLDYTGDMLESIEKARAIDSQMYLGLSRYLEEPFLAGKSMGYAKVIAPDGRVIASTGHRLGVCIAEFDPKWRMPFWGEHYKDMREIFDTIRRPDLYGPIVEPKDKKSDS